MIRGFIAGIFWGSVLGVIALAMTSQMADWRDLTPAVTGTEIVEERLPDAVPDFSDGAGDAPVVTAGTGAVQPESPARPGVATESAPSIAAPSVDTAAAGAPAEVLLPESVAAPEARVPSTAGVEVAAIDSSPAPGRAGEVAQRPRADDVPPQATDTATALTPARLAPKPQTGIGEQPQPVAVGAAPEVTAVRRTDAPPVTERSAALAPLEALPQTAPSLPTAPTQPAAADGTETTLSRTDGTDAVPLLPGAVETSENRLDAPVLPGAPTDGPAPVTVEAETSEPLTPAAPAALPDKPEVPESVEVAGLAPETTPAAPIQPAAPKPVLPEAGAQVSVEAPQAQADAMPAETVTEPARGETRVALADTDTAPAERALPRITRVGSDGASDLPGVRIRRMPGISADANSGPAPAPEAASGATDDGPGQNAPALARNAVEFANANGEALLSIVLVHQPGAAIEALPVPMTFAVPASAPDAAEAAAAYRAAGLEVALIPDLPAGARAQDVAVALDVNLTDISGAVALIDATGEVFQGNRAAVAQIVAAAAGTGHGVVTRAQGLDSAGRLADREGVAAARIYAQIEPGETDRGAISRALDRAAFRARSDGRLILSGTGSPEHLSAILAWALENRDGDVTLAPLSAVLQSAAR